MYSYGGYFTSAGPKGKGVYGASSGTSGVGVYGKTSGSSAKAVMGVAEGEGTGGYFYSASGAGLLVMSGNAGIGTSSPEAALDVDGAIRTTGETGVATGQGMEFSYNSDDYKGKIEVRNHDNDSMGNLYLGAGHISVGTTDYAERLNVAGNISAEDYRVPSLERTLLIGPAEFQPRAEWYGNPDSDTFTNSDKVLSTLWDNADGRYRYLFRYLHAAPLRLPDGAIITEMEFRVKTQFMPILSRYAPVTCELEALPGLTSMTTVASVAGGGDLVWLSLDFTNGGSSPGYVIDNQNNAYQINIDPPSDTQALLYGVKIHYKLTSLLP